MKEDYKAKWEYKAIRANQETLNELGKEGWELVSSCVEESPTFARGVVTHYLKRPLTESQQLLNENQK